jgi:hypothetical protein
MGLVSCNYPVGGANPAARYSVDATLTPVFTPTVEYIDAQPEELSNYLAEEFAAGFPQSWEVLQSWDAEEGIVKTSEEGAQIIIPGIWQDMTLINQFRIAPDGGMAIQFNKSENGTYQISLSTNSVSADWMPAEGEAETLVQVDHPIDEDWHTLFLRARYGKVTLMLDDDQPLLKLFNTTLSPKGSIAVIKLGSGLLEIDRLVIAPPGMGPGVITPTPQP